MRYRVPASVCFVDGAELQADDDLIFLAVAPGGRPHVLDGIVGLIWSIAANGTDHVVDEVAAEANRAAEDIRSDVENFIEELIGRGLLEPDGSPEHRPIRVLMVCTANISRSPYAQLRAQQLGGGSIQVRSAGVRGFLNEEIDPEMAAILRATGVDPAPFRSRPITGALVDEADVILTAEVSHRAWILTDWPRAEPKTFTLAQFAKAMRRLRPGVAGSDAVAAAFARSFPVNSADDVPDPYRRGPEAARATAEMIDGQLEIIIPRLIATEPGQDPYS